MLFYLTKQTIERFGIRLPEALKPKEKAAAEALIEKEAEDPLLVWGGKLFYQQGKKYLQLVNPATKLTVILADLKKKDMEDLSWTLGRYLMALFEGEWETRAAIRRMFENSPGQAFAALKDRSVISTLNHIQMYLLDDPAFIREKAEPGEQLPALGAARWINEKYLFTFVENGKTGYDYSSERFRSLVLERFGTPEGAPHLRVVK